VLDHVVCGSSLDASIERLVALAKRIFPAKHYGFLSMWRRIIDWITWWFSDNKYDSGTFEDVVKEEFGVNQRLFEYASQPTAGVKVAVTTSTVSTSQLRLFTNYNGVARKRQGKGMCTVLDVAILLGNNLAGYAILRPPDPYGEPFLWEMFVHLRLGLTWKCANLNIAVQGARLPLPGKNSWTPCPQDVMC
jgi:hypothetical protein